MDTFVEECAAEEELEVSETEENVFVEEDEPVPPKKNAVDLQAKVLNSYHAVAD